MSATDLPTPELAKQIRSNLNAAQGHLVRADDALNTKGRGTFPDLLDALEALELGRARLVQTITWSVRLAVKSDASWRQIGDSLGISRQAAQQKFGSTLVDRKLPGVD